MIHINDYHVSEMIDMKDSQHPNIKTNLADSFKTLLLQYPFEKITVKQITEDADVLRPTFYTYFQDKYEIFEWILQEELIRPLFALIDNDMEEEAFKMIFQYFSKNADFYSQAFQVQGQNSFEDTLTDELHRLFKRIFNKHQLTIEENIKLLTKENLALYYSKNVITILKFWMIDSTFDSAEVEEMFEASSFLFRHSLMDLLNIEIEN